MEKVKLEIGYIFQKNKKKYVIAREIQRTYLEKKKGERIVCIKVNKSLKNAINDKNCNIIVIPLNKCEYFSEEDIFNCDKCFGRISHRYLCSWIDHLIDRLYIAISDDVI